MVKTTHHSTLGALHSVNKWREVIISNRPDDECIKQMKLRRPEVEIIKALDVSDKNVWAYWTLHSVDNKLQLDGCFLEPYFLGSKEFTIAETVEQWYAIINNRVNFNHEEFDLSSGHLFSTFNGRFQDELNSCIRAVTLASHVTRSLQNRFQFTQGGSVKDDDSPVTIADFSAQALIIDWLSRHFPGDKFIAEEDSELLKSNEGVRNGVLRVLESVTRDQWSKERLYETLDKGTYSPSPGQKGRVWTCDPVDGTKGFVRGMHFCVAMWMAGLYFRY